MMTRRYFHQLYVRCCFRDFELTDVFIYPPEPRSRQNGEILLKDTTKGAERQGRKAGKRTGDDEIKQQTDSSNTVPEVPQRERKVPMKLNPIITVGRQYGSGGREVAKKLAQTMNISFYDKELLAEASKDSGICQEVIETYDEKQEKRSFFSMFGAQGRMDPANMYLEMPMNQRIFLAQFDTIRRIADEGSCVIVGRCADYVLSDHPNVLNVFIKADMENRIQRIIKLYQMDPMKAEETIRKADKQRATYYNYYATGTWGDVNNYHLCVDTGVLGVDGAVELIRRAVELQEEKAEDDKIEW